MNSRNKALFSLSRTKVLQDQLPGLPPSSAECIARYLEICESGDQSHITSFLDRLIDKNEEKHLLLIVTSRCARIKNKILEYFILEHIYSHKKVPLYLRIYANTRCCYKVSNSPNLNAANIFLRRGYECLHYRQACGSSENSKRNRIHIGFSLMLAMLHVQITHRMWSEAHAFGAGAIGEIARFPTGVDLTGAYYGTSTRIARIIGLQYLLDICLDYSLENAAKYAYLLKQSFSLALSKADLNMTRYEELLMVQPIYRLVADSQARRTKPEDTIPQLAKYSFIINKKSSRKALRRLENKFHSTSKSLNHDNN